MNKLKRRGEIVGSALRDICEGNHLLEAKKFHGSKKAYLKAVRKYKALSKDTYYLGELARAYRKLAILFTESGNDIAALKFCKKARSVLKKCYSNEKNIDVLRRVGYMNARIFSIYKKLNRVSKMQKAYDEALYIFREIGENEAVENLLKHK